MAFVSEPIVDDAHHRWKKFRSAAIRQPVPPNYSIRRRIRWIYVQCRSARVMGTPALAPDPSLPFIPSVLPTGARLSGADIRVVGTLERGAFPLTLAGAESIRPQFPPVHGPANSDCYHWMLVQGHLLHLRVALAKQLLGHCKSKAA